MDVGLLICTMISENQGFEKLRSITKTRKISGSANLSGIHPKKGWIYTINLKIIQVPNLKINQGLQNLTFFQGLKQALISQNLDFQKSECRLKGRVRTPRTQENGPIPNQATFLELCLKITHDLYFFVDPFSHVTILNAFITEIKSRRNFKIWATQNDLISKFYCWCITVIAPNLTPC